MSRERKGPTAAIALFVVLLALTIVFSRGREPAERRERPAPSAPGVGTALPLEETDPPPAPERATARRCERVVDGDTVILDGGERVRLVGVDTPELHRQGTPVQYFAREASAFTRRLVAGKRVRLDHDQERKDKYGRTLGYLWLEDGTFVNFEIVRRGYGFAYTRHPFRYLDEFRLAERAAREEGAGLWAAPDSIGAAAGPPA